MMFSDKDLENIGDIFAARARADFSIDEMASHQVMTRLANFLNGTPSVFQLFSSS